MPNLVTVVGVVIVHQEDGTKVVRPYASIFRNGRLALWHKPAGHIEFFLKPLPHAMTRNDAYRFAWEMSDSYGWPLFIKSALERVVARFDRNVRRALKERETKKLKET
jgi:hypothetical protein